ncbi:hypothetical protein JCM11251_006325 [Rhodosporidiobolus azoricus]
MTSSTERSSSPTSSTRGDRIRSFTTSSQTSADLRIAAARAAREQRRRERERDGREGQPLVVEEADEDDVSQAATIPLVQVDEVESLDRDGDSSPPVSGSNEPSLAPKLRLHTPSDRSCTPSVPSTPSRSAFSHSPAASPSASSAAPDEPDDPSPALTAVPTLTLSRRFSFEVVEIPPFRPKTASPAPSSPSTGLPTADDSSTSPPPVRTPSPGVVLSDGLMARLKAQRAARAAAEAEAKGAEEARPTPSSLSGSTTEPNTTPSEVARRQPLPVSIPSDLAERATSPTPPLSTSTLPPPADKPASTSRVVEDRSPLHATTLDPPASPRAVVSSSHVDPVSREQWGATSKNGASIASAATQSSRFSPPRGRHTQASKVYGRNGEEFDFDFTELSDVQEQSERSSLSTWRDSTSQHRRSASTSTNANLPASDSPGRRIFPSEPSLSRHSHFGSVGRQQADGSFATSSFDRSYPALPSSYSTKSVSSLPSRHSRSRSAADPDPEKRLDATSRLLGRSGSSSSIFSGSSSIASSNSNARPVDRPPLPPSSPPRSSSPTRRISPEVARRAAQFETSSDGRRSPTKPAPLFSPSSERQSFLSDNVTIPSSHPKPPAVPPKPIAASEEEGEHPLGAIERRRTQRRQDIESFALRLGDTGGSPPHEPTQDRKADRDRTWSEIEAVERAQEEKATSSDSRGNGRTPSSEVKEQVERRWRREVVEGQSSGAKSTRSSSTLPGPLCEGYLRVPPPDNLDIDDALAHPENWVARYCVLTSDILECRPTDQNHQSRPIIAFYLTDCAYIEDEPDKPLRTSDAVTAARLDSNHSTSTRARSEPLSTVSAQATPVSDAASSVRSLTPPGSRYSETRGTVYGWDKGEVTGEKASLPSYPHDTVGIVDEKLRLRGPSSRPTSSKAHSYVDEKRAKPRGERDLFSLYHRPSPRPGSSASLRSDRPLPPLPPKDASILPSHLPSSMDDVVNLGHRRARSDLSSYNTPHNQPPFRPIPTRASPSHELPSPALFSPSSMLPARPSTRSSTSTLSIVPTEEIDELHHDLQRLLNKVETKGGEKVHRDERYRRLQDRLRAFKQRHGGLAGTESGEEEDATLAEKVDYLLEMSEALLRKQEEAAAFHAEEDRARLAAKETELASGMPGRIDNPMSLQQAESSRGSTPSVHTIKAGRSYDEATFTTRAGIHSASEKLDWERDLAAYRIEANVAGNSPQLSSLASPTTVRHARETASRKLEGLSPPVSLNTMKQERQAASRRLDGLPRRRDEKLSVPPASSLANAIPPYQGFGRIPQRSKDPFAGSGVVEPTTEQVRPTEDPGEAWKPVAPLAATPTLRPYSEWSGALSVGGSSRRSDVSLEQAILRILDGFDRQNGTLERGKEHQDRMSQVMGELAKWVAGDRTLRDQQFQELLSAVNGIAQHVSGLPQHLLSALQASETTDDSYSITAPTVDSEGGQEEDELHIDASAGVAAASLIGVQDRETVKKKPSLALNPLSSFAKLDRQIVSGIDGKHGGSTGKLKGPRMPGIRLWGAPEPVADRTNRWGGAAATVKAVEDKKQTEEALAADAEAKKPPHGPIVEALQKDEHLGAALQALAVSEGTEVDAGTLSLAVFEILQTMREIQKKQAQDDKRQAEERAANAGLTVKEKAELEAKKAEIVRLEREMQMTTERTAHINELVAQLAERTDKSDAMLAQIAKNVSEGKVTQMDPALSAEVKKLLGGVRAGVDDHVKDFRGQLTSEVQRMFKEVGKLRDEKKQLQADIAELMQFQAKQGGPVPKSAPLAASAPPKPTTDMPADPPKPGMPSSGFFGPRPLK